MTPAEFNHLGKTAEHAGLSPCKEIEPMALNPRSELSHHTIPTIGTGIYSPLWHLHLRS
jgi:hypothetical protein